MADSDKQRRPSPFKNVPCEVRTFVSSDPRARMSKNNVKPDGLVYFFQARPRRRSGEMVARDLKKRLPSRPPSPDLPENLSIKKTKSSDKVNKFLIY